MREIRDSGIEWLEEIPSHWEVMPNKRIMKKKKEICSQYQGEDILSLTMNGVIIRDLNAGGKMPATFDGYQRLTPGNLLMCLFDIDVTPRCIGLIKNEGLSSPAYSQFVVNEKGYAPYYYYYYLNLDHTKELLHMAKNLRHSLTEDQLGEIGVAVPPYAEQIRIVEALEERLPKVDTLIANVQAQIEKLNIYRQTVITETVTKGLDPTAQMKSSGVQWIGDIPAHWGTPKISMLAAVSSGATPDRTYPEYWNGSISWLKTGELQNNEIYESEEYITEAGLKNSSVQLYEPNTILVAMYGQGKTRGMTALLRIKSTTNQACAGIVVTSNLISYEYLWKTLMGAYNGLRDLAVGSGQPNLNQALIKDFRIPLPPVQEQNEICKFLARRIPQIDRLIAIKQAKIEKLEQYKRSLIYEYVTGKREVL